MCTLSGGEVSDIALLERDSLVLDCGVVVDTALLQSLELHWFRDGRRLKVKYQKTVSKTIYEVKKGLN